MRVDTARQWFGTNSRHRKFSGGGIGRNFDGSQFESYLSSTDKFEIARGEKGMVMTVFTLPSYDVVFKVIKDTFDYPKTTTRRDVIRRYRLVFRHDREGRLVDAQEFEHLWFEKDRFTPELLAELLRSAAHSVTVEGDYVEIRHLYMERRLAPPQKIGACPDLYRRAPQPIIPVEPYYPTSGCCIGSLRPSRPAGEYFRFYFV